MHSEPRLKQKLELCKNYNTVKTATEIEHLPNYISVSCLLAKTTLLPPRLV
jgi:hypothetical protein